MPTYPASVTPFDAQGRVDMPGIARLIAWFRSHGCDGIVIAGTQGEGPSLSAMEKRDMVRDAVKLADGWPVILGVATPSIEEAVWSCKQAHQAGAAAALVLPPGYYREAGEAGLIAWFEELLARSPIGVLIYNFPQRTGITLSASFMGHFRNHERMIGVKDSSGNVENLATYAEALKGGDKSMFVGNETLLLDALTLSWSGTISGSANAIPNWLSQIVHEWPTDRESAETKFALIQPALLALRSAGQPAMNKAVLHRLGVLKNASPRLPLMPSSAEELETVWPVVSSLIK